MTSFNLCINPDIEPERRFLAALAAQCSGVLFLFITARIFDMGNTTLRPDIERGIQWMDGIVMGALVALIVGAVIPLWPSKISRGFMHENIDKMVKIYLVADIFLIMILVCQQGGLTKSVLFPFFFLIPVAHRVVERKEHEYWILYSHVALIVVMIITFIIPLWLISNGWFSLWGLQILPTSDLTDLKISYAFAILLISIVSLGTPVLMEVIKCIWPERGDKTSPSDPAAQGQ